MGIFSKTSAPQEPSYSRAWIGQNGPGERKVSIALAILNRMLDEPAAAAAVWGQPLDDHAFEGARLVAAAALTQDRSLARHVARDLTLFFETLGGLAVHQTAALAAIGINDPSGLHAAGAGSRAVNAGQNALAIARTIRDRFQGGAAAPADLAIYAVHFEDPSNLAHERAIDVAAWSAVVTARLRTAGPLQGAGIAAFNPNARNLATMSAIGWYPNPVNAGDTSGGDAQIERWWDGTDWTDRVRHRSGRTWQEVRSSMYTTPSN